jgi:hypothetical protein
LAGAFEQLVRAARFGKRHPLRHDDRVDLATTQQVEHPREVREL